MARIPTVKIVNGDNYKIINEADFDAGTMEIFEAKPSVDIPAEIDAMKKGELIEALEAFEADTSGKVAALKERLACIEAEL